MKKGIVLSGSRPTGQLHLGNYFGALENWVRLQDEYECYFFIADWHALTTGYENTSDIKVNITEMVADFLAAGLDPAKCTIFLQSSIAEHAELHLLFSMMTPLSWLLRCPSYKDQLAQIKDRDIATYGFLGYPCLQAADILIYKAGFVPVGEDQLPHVEMTREIARRFNFLYGNVFPEPHPLLTHAKLLPGTDGRKMSKSYGNTIALAEKPEDIKKKISTMVTDPARIHKNDPGDPSVCSVYSYQNVFGGDDTDAVKDACINGSIGCVQCKRHLTEMVVKRMTPIYEKRQEIMSSPSIIREVVEDGNRRAATIAKNTLSEVKEAMKINWL